MASFHQHVAVSTAFGVGYGAVAYFGFGIDGATCMIAGGLTGLAGMLPDLDAPTGQPVREVLGFTASLVPVLMVKQLRSAASSLYDKVIGGEIELTPQMIVVVMAIAYFAVRFGGAWLLETLTVHRGMLHSIPAALIVATGAFLLLDAPTLPLRLFLAGGPFIGFLSHLSMDELWSVKLGYGGVGLKKSAGTALKFFSGSIPATLTTYVFLLTLSYLALHDPAVNDKIAHWQGRPAMPQIARELIENVRR